MNAAQEQFYGDFWLFMKRNKNIEFDENGLSTDAYWNRLNAEAREFAERKYPTTYAKNMVLSFMHEMERRAGILEKQYFILKQQEQSFEKGSPEWDFFSEFVPFSRKYDNPPILLPDESNKKDVDEFWEKVCSESKELKVKYGPFTDEILNNFVNELWEKAKEKQRQGVDGTQLDFNDIGYEELGFC